MYWGKPALTANAIAIGSMFAILIGFLVIKSLPFLTNRGVSPLLASQWLPRSGLFGVSPLMWGSVYVAILALAIAIPFGVGTGVFLYDFCPPIMKGLLQRVVYLLANIPPVVYGFLGIVLILPQLRSLFGGSGYSTLASSGMLAVLIAPTLIVATYTSLSAVPQECYEGILALGADKLEALRYVVLPIAWPGVVAGLLLGLGRAMGETMIVLMLSGNVASFPLSPLSPIRTLTGNIALETSYAAGDHRRALSVCGLILLLLVAFVDQILAKTFLNRLGPNAYRNLISSEGHQEAR